MALWKTEWTAEDITNALQFQAMVANPPAVYAFLACVILVALVGMGRMMRARRRLVPAPVELPTPPVVLDGLEAFKDLVQSMSDKLQRRLTEVATTLEDKMEAITTLPTLIQQISAMEPQLKKITAVATAIATMSKWDVEGLKTMVGNVKQAVEASCTSTREATAALLKELMATHLKQVQDRFASARETAAEHYQKIQAANAEGSAVMKSHTSLLSSFRAKQTEFEEILTNCRKHLGRVQGVEERVSELGEGQQRMLDRLEAVLEILQGLRESTPRVPYQSPPTAPPAEKQFRSGSTSFWLQRQAPDNLPSSVRPRPCRTGKPRWTRQL